MATNNRRLSFFSLIASLGLIGGWILSNPAPAAAAPQAQVYYQTPTPLPDGRILYIVKEGDTCLGISLLTKVDMKQLRTLNRLDDACTLVPGQKILLATVTPSTATPGPVPTATPSTPTATPFAGAGQICVFLFEDVNGNSMPDPGENQIAGGAVSLADRIGKYSKQDTTTSSTDPLCFTDLPEGDYNISVAPPQGYNATTSMNFPVKIQPGDTQNINFGAQISNKIIPGAGTKQPQSSSPILAILGGVLVVSGAGLGFYFWRLKTTSSS